MIVYRIENSEGFGPYYDGQGWTTIDHNTERPSPHRDGIKFQGYEEMRNYRCGFYSLDLLFSWFSAEELKNLDSMGFFLVEYEIDPDYVKVGKWQIMFYRHYAKLILRKRCSPSSQDIPRVESARSPEPQKFEESRREEAVLQPQQEPEENQRKIPCPQDPDLCDSVRYVLSSKDQPLLFDQSALDPPILNQSRRDARRDTVSQSYPCPVIKLFQDVGARKAA